MKHFSNPELEEIGLRMEYRIFRIATTISPEPLTGYDWELSESEIEPIRKELWMNNIGLARAFYSENFTDLQLIKSKVGNNDPKFLELSSQISFWVFIILKLGVGLAFNLTNTSDFKRNLNNPEVIKVKKDLNESLILLSKVQRELYMDSDIKEKIDNMLKMISDIENKFHTKGFKFW
jgi:hypothetical protein